MILLVLALEIWTFLFVGFFGSELLGSYPLLRIAAQILFVGPLVVWAALRLRGRGLQSRLDWAILAALACLFVVSLFSADVIGSLESTGLALACALTFWVMRDVGRIPRLRTAVVIGASYAVVLWTALVAIWWIQEKVGWIRDFGTFPNLESSQVFIWGTSNAFPILSLLAVPLLRWQPAGLPRRLLTVVWAAAAIVVIPLSVGRAAWFGFAAAVVAYEALSGWPRVLMVRSWLRSRGLERAALAASGIVVLGALVVVLMRREDLVSSALDGRPQIWGQALGIFAADPLTGGGPSTFSWLRLVHVPDYTYAVPVRLTHDVPLQVLADGGLILAAGFGWLLATYMQTARRFLDDPMRRTTFAVLVGFAAACLFDDFSSLPAVIALVVTLAAWVVPEPQPAAEPRRMPSFAVPLVAGLVGAVCLYGVASCDFARWSAGGARSAAVRGDWSAALQGFETAASAHPGDAAYWLGLGLARAELNQTDAARDAYARARDLSPGDPRGWASLGSLPGDRAERARLLAEAARKTTDGTYSLLLGRVDNDGDALTADATAVALEPDLYRAFPNRAPPSVQSPRDKVLAVVPEILDSIAEQAAISKEAVLWDIALANDRLPADAGFQWRAVDLARRGDRDGAIRALAEAEREAPYNGLTLEAKLAVARLTCDPSTYERVSDWLGPYHPARSAALTIIREHVYREDALSSYLPPSAGVIPQDQRWPWAFIGDPPACPGWFGAGQGK